MIAVKLEKTVALLAPVLVKELALEVVLALVRVAKVAVILSVQMAHPSLERWQMGNLVRVVILLAWVIAAVLLVFNYARELAEGIAKDALKNVEMLAVQVVKGKEVRDNLVLVVLVLADAVLLVLEHVREIVQTLAGKIAKTAVERIVQMDAQ